MSNTNIPQDTSGLSQAQRLLLQKRLLGASATNADGSIISRRPAGTPAPLSFAQQRLWFLDQFEPNNALYNIPVAVRLSGFLRIAVLERAVGEIARRHDVLRTTIAAEDGLPFQLIARPEPVTLALVDLADLPFAAREAQVRSLATEEAHRPFDLSRGPLVRWWVIKLGRLDHVVLMTMHHVVSDAWSISLVIRELSILYTAFSARQPSPLTELPLQYADYAYWQRQQLSGEILAAELNYWRQQLAQAPPLLELPLDHPRPPKQTFTGTAQSFSLSPALLGALENLGRQEGATLFMTLLAAFSTLLYRISGQDDILIGTPVAGRSGRIEFEQLIGFFVSTLVIRTDLGGGVTFRQLLRRVRESTLGAFEHQNLPFEYLVQELHPERDLSRTPLFQVMFVLLNAPQGELSLPGLELRPVECERKTSNFDLTLTMTPGKNGLAGSLEYNSDLFEAATIKRLLNYFQILLNGIVNNPEQQLSSLPLMTDLERQQLLNSWNDTARDHTPRLRVDELFEAQVAETPHAVALESDQGQLTFDQVNRRANQLAHQLQALGVGPEVPVGICLHRSMEMVIGLLGILKAGGAYIPLDPNYPIERLAFMLQDVGAPVLITEERLRKKLENFGGTIVCTNAERGADGCWSEENPRNRAAPQSPAYVIYTSGSTGSPKGVTVLHGALSNLLLSMAERPGLTAKDTLLAVTTLSFDIAALELFLPLIVGARLVVASREVASDGYRLSLQLAKCGATVMQATPTTYEMLVEAGWQGTAGLRAWCGGEALSPNLADRLRERCSQVWNLFGPTETTIWSTVARVEEKKDSASIGRPIANTQTYILDRHLQLVPVGCGELYIGGSGLARGYVNRPGLTAEQFIPDLFGPEYGARLYKTGDRARYWSDGRIEFLGRLDYQIKLRGHRIELNEIESVLMEHATVRHAVVIAEHQGDNDKRLVAYLVGEGEGPSIRDVRGYLKTRLPDYMLPAVFVTLEALPLTPNGKVDRRALPAPDEALARDVDDFGAPRTPTEEILADIFADVLRVTEVGSRDDFFELGGHSLLATRVAARVRSSFGVELPLRSLFERPSVAALSEEVEALLRAGSESEVPPLVRRDSVGAAPLSFAQQRLWFLDQFEPGSSAYNMPFALRLKGSLDVAALEGALTEVRRRHEVLRTRFAVEEGEPVQVVDQPTPFRLPVVEVGEGQERQVEQLIQAEASLPFDLEAGPLVRGRLVRLSEDEHVLVFTMHHIISDGWSTGVLMREVGALYDAYSRGAESPLSELPIQYADYSVWQREWLQGEALERQVDYWRRQLADAPALELPTDKVRPAVQRYEGATVSFALGAEVARGLRELSRREGATLFMTLLAVFEALLGRYAGQTDICVGTPVAGRTRAETEDLIGFFVNTLVLRTELGGDPTFRELVGRVKEACLGAYVHQDVPFEKLVEELQPEREMSRSPLFQVMFTVQNAPTEQLRLRSLELGSFGAERRTANFDLTLTLSERDEGLAAALEYSTDLFEAATIERMLRHYERMLTAVCADPSLRLSELPMLSDAELRQLIYEWNDTRAEFPRKCVHTLFEAQAARTPDSIAVVHANEHLTYCKLNVRANRLAHRLRRQGVGPESRVGLCVERSMEMIVGMLGVLKAGGAYVPLDPQYPRERLSLMLEDARVEVLLTQERLIPRLPESGAALISLDEEPETFASESAENPDVEVCASNLAYLIYTSGSTGRPKGVMIQHDSLANFNQSATLKYEINSADRVLQFASISFDTSAEEVYPCLTCGATLVLRSDEMVSSAATFLRQAEAQRLTVLDLPASYWHELTERMAEESLTLPPSLRLVIIGGERALPERLALWHRHAGGRVRLMNGYGPSEVTVIATVGELIEAETGTEAARGEVSIGRPIHNARVYILDGQLRPAPAGLPGELYAGGAGLARGYLDRSGITAEKFIPDPFSREPGARLYRTGDLVRHRGDGQIEFVGRVDDQVKVRGYRVELGEIESALRAHTDVREVAVIVREDDSGDKRLVAYVVKGEAESVDTGELRAHLSELLPGYMIPSAFVELGELPLTPNGKVDSRALPAPDQALVRSVDESQAPRTLTEGVLADIFADVLHVASVGVGENFFELGGHSLLATRVVSRVRTVFGVEVALRSLFERPTVAGLSEEVEALLRAGRESKVPPLVRRESGVALPLSFAQQRLWFLDQLEPHSSAYNMPFALRLRGELDVAALERALTEVIRRHEVLRTTFEIVGEQPTQVIGAPTPFELQLITVGEGPEQEQRVRRLIEEEASLPFNLEAGPLVRARLLQLGAEEFVLLCTMHHIVSDGWSMGVLSQELTALYTAYVAGEASPLPELTIQYADFAHWQREWLEGEVLEGQLSYWKKQLAGAPAVLELPTDYPRPAIQSFRGAHQPLTLSEDLSAKLKQLSQREGVTLFMTLLAAWQMLLSRYSGQEDIVVGSPIANRNRAETEQLIGFFVNTLVMRTDLRGNPSFEEVLRRVREVALGAYAHQDVPFEKLVEELQPERDMSRTPLFQVMMVLQNAPQESSQLPGLQVSAIGGDGEGITTKFDLMFNLGETSHGLVGAVSYNMDLFEAATMTRMVRHFEALVESVVSNPEQRLSELQLLTKEEQEQILVEWNDTAAEYPQDKCIHQLFEEQVERTPEAIALVYEDEEVTYRELNERANQLAHYLQSLGVGPETLVGICIERSVEMVVGLLGILKAGGAYVPLDPAYPHERLSFMIEDAGVPVLLTQESLRQVLPQFPARLLCLDSNQELIAQHGRHNLAPDVSPDNLAYINYTSGSTGYPKGVEVRHGAVIRLLFGVDYVALDASQTLLHLSPISFDASTLELWGALLHGSRCVLFAQSVPTAAALREAIEVQGVSTMWLTSSLYNAVMDEAPQALSGLKQLLIGGEALSVDHVRQGAYHLPQTRMVNGYGPTESTTFTCCYQIPGEIEQRVRSIAIGRPIANTQVYILDEEQQVVPVGVTGELCIGGEGLARGYLGRAELTAERFIPNPFGRKEGARLYRTGDLARYLGDGNLEFVGRVDNQVKVRGFRIELGEIESALRQHLAIRESVVVAEENGPASKRLVAYVVPAEEMEITAGELRAYLKQRLPEYMMPSVFVTLEALPLTQNGKIDRRALPLAIDAGIDLDESYQAPQTPIQEILANIWAKALGLEKVGVQDNFFDSGGHSLLATRVFSRVKEMFDVELPLHILFDSPTVAAMAQAIADATKVRQGLEIPALKLVSRDEDLPLAFVQEDRLRFEQWARDEGLPVSSFAVTCAVRIEGHLDVRKLEQSLNEIVRRQEVFRTTFHTVEGKHFQRVNTTPVFSLSMIDFCELPETVREHEARQALEAEARRPFDLTRDLLLRATLTRLSENEHLLLLTVHHIVMDGWSLAILMNELATCYRAFHSGFELPVPRSCLQFADFAVWQRQWLKGAVRETLVAFWKRHLQGLLPIPELELRIARAMPSVLSYKAATAQMRVPADLLRALKELGSRQGVTLFMVLMAALKTLLFDYSGQDDIGVISPVANRNRAETENIIGWFANLVVFRTNLSGNPTFCDFLARTRAMCLSVYAHMELPFPVLLDELKYWDQPRRPYVSFNLQTAESLKQLQPSGLNVSPVSLDSARDVAEPGMQIDMLESSDGLEISLEYETDRFEAGDIAEFLADFLALLQRVVLDPEQKLADLARGEWVTRSRRLLS